MSPYDFLRLNGLLYEINCCVPRQLELLSRPYKSYNLNICLSNDLTYICLEQSSIMGVNTSGLLFKKEVASNRQYLENLLQKNITRAEKLPVDGNEFSDVTSDQVLAISNRGATLLHVDFDVWQDVIERMGSDFNNRDGVGFMLSETSMTFMFQFPSRYQQNIDVYTYEEGFHCEGPNRLDIQEDDDIVFDVLINLVEKYLGDLSTAEFTLYHFGEGGFETRPEESIITSTGDLPSIPRVKSVVKPPEVDFETPDIVLEDSIDVDPLKPMAMEQVENEVEVEAEAEVENEDGSIPEKHEIERGNDEAEYNVEFDPPEEVDHKSAIQEELEAFGRSYNEKELTTMSVDDLIEEFWFEAFQADGKRDPAIVRYVIELRRRGVKADKGKGHTLMYHHSRYPDLQAEAKRLSDRMLERDINKGRHAYVTGMDCVRTSVLEEEKRLRDAALLRDVNKDAKDAESASVFKYVLIGIGIFIAIVKGCG